jgi:hypothetical protein
VNRVPALDVRRLHHQWSSSGWVGRWMDANEVSHGRTRGKATSHGASQKGCASNNDLVLEIETQWAW